MKKRRLLIIGIFLIMIGILSILGISYASWRFTEVQSDFNTLGTKCFELSIENASSGITLDKTYPMSEEEGKAQDGYTFTVKNKCNTNAFYQVNLEELALEVKKLSNEYIKVSVNDSKGKNLNTYEEVTKTLDEAETSHKLTSGSLGPAGSENDEATYTVKLWMDEDTPIVSEVMNAAFQSKVSVVATYVEEEDLTNEITASTSSLSEYNTESETIEITVTSTDYKIIEVSEDGVNFEPLDNPGTTVTIEKTYTTETTDYLYFRDEIGTVQRVEVSTIKLDQSAPVITASSSDTWSSVNPITITLEDSKSGLSGYQITDDSGAIQRMIQAPTEWISVSGTTQTITYNASENKTYYIWSKDTLGNIDYEIVTISKVDTIEPVIVSITEQENYASTSIITAIVKDEESGITGYKFTTEEKEPTDWESVDNIITETTFTHEAEENGQIYFYVKDGAGHIVHESFEVTKVDSIAPSVSYAIASSTTGSNSWYKALTLEATAVDNESGVSSASYCVTTSDTCTPDTTATLIDNKYQITLSSNASALKVCSVITDIKGNTSEVLCSSGYKVDTTSTIATTLTGTTKSGTWTTSSNTLTNTPNPSSVPSGITTTWYQVPEYKYSSASSGFTITEKTDSTTGSKYWNAQFSKTSGTDSQWISIQFPTYSYIVGNTYRIHFKIRVNSVSNMGMDIRNAAVSNDYGTDVKLMTFNKVTNGWVEGTIDRVFKSSYTVGSTTYTTLSPRIEMYSADLKLTDTITSRSIDFDFKDFWVEEIEQSSISTVSNNLAVKLSDTTNTKAITSSENNWYVSQVTTVAGLTATSNKFNAKVDTTSSITPTLTGTTKSDTWTTSSNTLTNTNNPTSVVSGYTTSWYQVPEYKYTSSSFTMTEKTDSTSGSKYWNATYSKTTGTTDTWASIQFPTYAYTVGKTYRIHFKVRVNSVNNFSLVVRHALVGNDYGSGLVGQWVGNVTNGWREYTLDRTIPSSHVVGGTTYTTFSPRIEIYSDTLKLTDTIISRSIDFDIKDFWVEELEPGSNSIIANNLAVKLSDTANTKAISNSANNWYVTQVTTGVGVTATSNKFNAKVDTVNPTAKVSASVSGNSISVSAANSSDDMSGIKTYYYSRDGSTYYSSTSSSYTFTGLADGTYTLYVKVMDNAGRTSSVATTTATVVSTNVYVSSSGNDTSGNGSSSAPYATLAKAYGRVANGGNIILMSNITQSSAVTFGTASKSVNLISNGSSVYSITRGSSLTTYMLIINNGASLTTKNVIFDGNSVASTQTMLAISNATVNLNSGTIVRNAISSTDYHGAGIYIGGSATLNINGATITNNKTTGTYSQGAGIYINGATVNMNSGTISNNNSSDVGGGVMLWHGTFNMYGGTVTGNYATDAGGGFSMGAESVSTYLNLYGGTVSGNTAGVRGGNIYANLGSSTTKVQIYVAGGTLDGGYYLHDYATIQYA